MLAMPVGSGSDGVSAVAAVLADLCKHAAGSRHVWHARKTSKKQQLGPPVERLE